MSWMFPTRTRWRKSLLVAPVLGLGVLALSLALSLPLGAGLLTQTQGGGVWILAVVAFAVAGAVLAETLGKYLAVCLCWGLWHLLAGLLVWPLPLWAGWIVILCVSLWVTALTVLVGRCWGRARYRDMARRGRGMLEWRWIWTGRDFARGHPWFRRSFGVWAMALALVLSGAQLWAALAFGSPSFSVADGLVPGFYAVALLALLALHPAAYPLGFAGLVPGMPWTIPVLFYWADGRVPNLIYRHRFETLIQGEVSDV